MPKELIKLVLEYAGQYFIETAYLYAQKNVEDTYFFNIIKKIMETREEEFKEGVYLLSEGRLDPTLGHIPNNVMRKFFRETCSPFPLVILRLMLSKTDEELFSHNQRPLLRLTLSRTDEELLSENQLTLLHLILSMINEELLSENQLTLLRLILSRINEEFLSHNQRPLLRLTLSRTDEELLSEDQLPLSFKKLSTRDKAYIIGSLRYNYGEVLKIIQEALCTEKTNLAILRVLLERISPDDLNCIFPETSKIHPKFIPLLFRMGALDAWRKEGWVNFLESALWENEKALEELFKIQGMIVMLWKENESKFTAIVHKLFRNSAGAQTKLFKLLGLLNNCVARHEITCEQLFEAVNLSAEYNKTFSLNLNATGQEENLYHEIERSLYSLARNFQSIHSLNLAFKHRHFNVVALLYSEIYPRQPVIAVVPSEDKIGSKCQLPDSLENNALHVMDQFCIEIRQEENYAYERLKKVRMCWPAIQYYYPFYAGFSPATKNSFKNFLELAMDKTRSELIAVNNLLAQLEVYKKTFQLPFGCTRTWLHSPESTHRTLNCYKVLLSLLMGIVSITTTAMGCQKSYDPDTRKISLYIAFVAWPLTIILLFTGCFAIHWRGFYSDNTLSAVPDELHHQLAHLFNRELDLEEKVTMVIFKLHLISEELKTHLDKYNEITLQNRDKVVGVDSNPRSSVQGSSCSSTNSIRPAGLMTSYGAFAESKSRPWVAESASLPSVSSIQMPLLGDPSLFQL